MSIGIIAGLKRELRCLGFGVERSQPVVTFAAAGCPDRARERAEHWIASGRVRALMSFGLCGGLDPALAPGTVLVAHDIALPEGGRLRFDPRWAQAIAARIPEARVAPLLGASNVAMSVAEKRRLFVKHAVPALDMESRGVAEAARAARIPFVALRAVADPAERTLPPLAARAINAEGRLNPLRVLLGLLKRPRDLGALLALAADARRAYDALAAARSSVHLPELAPQRVRIAAEAEPRLPALVPQL